jgi:hypothetical protein
VALFLSNCGRLGKGEETEAPSPLGEEAEDAILLDWDRTDRQWSALSRLGHPGFTAIVRAQCRSLANSSNWSSFNVKFFIMNFFGK